MSQGFIKLYREKGAELLEEDPQAYLLLSQIALRARRMDGEYSRIPLKANQAFLGDHKKAGLSRQQYRNVQKRLTRYGLATFESTNKGTIATLTNLDVFDINAEPSMPLHKPANSSIKTEKDEPTKNQPTANREPARIQEETFEAPLTRKEESKKATTPTQQAEAALYECLQKNQHLSSEEKRSLMIYTETRVVKAIKWSIQASIKTTLIQALHWHCKQIEPPLPPEKALTRTSQQHAAWEYNQFLESHGYTELSEKNHEAIPQYYAHIIAGGITTTIILTNPIETVKSGFKNSKDELLNIKDQNQGLI
jgi:hypothetical protein